MKILSLLLLLFQAISTGNETNSYTDLSYSLDNVAVNAGVSVTIHPENGTLFLYFKESGNIVQFSEKGSVDTLTTVQFDNNFGQRIDVHPNGEELLFWDNGIGRVHSMNLNSYNLVRLDESHNHMNQFGHGATLGEDGNIYAMGGYGYWEYKNQLIYYSQSDKQWELISKPDPNKIPENSGGRLFLVNDTFLYFNKGPDTNSRHSSAYWYLQDENRWELSPGITQLMSHNLIDLQRSATVYSQTSTYAVDRERYLIGFLGYSRSQTHFAYLLDSRREHLFKLDLSQLSIYDAKNFFYVPERDHWVILGKPFSTNRRDQLIVKTFRFDESHPALTAVQNENGSDAFNIFILGSFGGLFLLIVGWLVYRNILTPQDEKDRKKNRSKSSTTIEFIEDQNDGEISVYFNGKKFNYSGDPYLTNMIEVIYEMKKEEVSEMLISKLDEKLFSDNIHSSYKSRTRRKVIQVINSECDYDIIEEKRSQTDKRVKVIDVNLNKIKISSQST